MYVIANGEFKRNSDDLLFIDSINKKAFQFQGLSAKLLVIIAPFFTGTIKIEEMLTFFNNTDNEITDSELMNFLMELEKLKVISLITESKGWLGVATDKDSNIDVDLIFNNDELKNIYRVIDTTLKPSATTKFVVAIDSDHNHDFFINVDNYCTEFEIPWLRVGISEPNIYLGPTFFPDGGPCYTCFYNRLSWNSMNELEKGNWITSYGFIEKSIFTVIHREIIKFLRNDKPLTTFETEIKVNLDTFENSKYKVFSVPSCSVCQNKKVLLHG